MKATIRALIVAAVGAVALSASAVAQDPVDVDRVVSESLAAYAQGDFATAVRLLRPVAEKGDAEAQALLGGLYDFGEGVMENNAEAAKWYRLAAKQGYAYAQLHLGFMYSSGEGVPQNYAEAIRWYRLAAEQGDAGAQSRLGLMYANGEGASQNDVEAYKWLALAAAQQGIHAGARDAVRRRMTPAQIAEAQKLAAEWKPKE